MGPDGAEFGIPYTRYGKLWKVTLVIARKPFMFIGRIESNSVPIS